MAAKSDVSSSLRRVGEHARRPSPPAAPRCTSSVASPPSSRIMFGPAVAELEDPVGVVPVLLERLALVGEHRRAAGGDGGGGVVLGREDVAGRPAHLGAERLQRLDQHRGLDGHVQRAGDARALERLAARRTPRGSPSAPASRVSAMAISLRPQSASERSATLKSVNLRCRSSLFESPETKSARTVSDASAVVFS